MKMARHLPLFVSKVEWIDWCWWRAEGRGVLLTFFRLLSIKLQPSSFIENHIKHMREQFNEFLVARVLPFRHRFFLFLFFTLAKYLNLFRCTQYFLFVLFCVEMFRKYWMPTHRRILTLPANATMAHVTWIFY